MEMKRGRFKIYFGDKSDIARLCISSGVWGKGRNPRWLGDFGLSVWIRQCCHLLRQGRQKDRSCLRFITLGGKKKDLLPLKHLLDVCPNKQLHTWVLNPCRYLGREMHSWELSAHTRHLKPQDWKRPRGQRRVLRPLSWASQHLKIKQTQRTQQRSVLVP